MITKLKANLTRSVRGYSFSTSLYIWLSNVSPGMRSDDYKNRFAMQSLPQKIEFFEDKCPKYIYMGPRHSSVIDEKGDLYTFGSGNWGVLGHGDEKSLNYHSPKKVDYFIRHNKKVKKVCLGDFHSIVLTEDGEVYSWGYGGRKGFLGFFGRDPGALGHGDWKHYFVPKRIDYFSKNKLKIKDISCGIRHSVCLTECGKIFTFGYGEYGLLGNGSNKDSLIPELNDYIELNVKEDETNEIIKIDCADEYTAILTKNGNVYVWGKNNQGQLGIGSGIGIDIMESEKFPTKVLKDDNIQFKDLNCGENGMMLKDQNGILYKTGWRLHYTLKRIEMSTQVQTDYFFCGNSFFCMIDNQKNIYQWGNLFKPKFAEKTDYDMLKINAELFEGKKVLSISGKFKSCGAIVLN